MTGSHHHAAVVGRSAAGAVEVVAEVAQLLRERGERMTRPRRAVLTALAREGEHLTAYYLICAFTELYPTVHRASVYRTLDALSHLGVVQHVHTSHGLTTYHLMPLDGPHPHVQCRVCGAVYDLPEDLLDAVAGRLVREDGFVLDTGHVALSGTCATCIAAGH